MESSTSGENAETVSGRVWRDRPWTVEEAQRVLEEQQQSGESVRIFAKKRALDPKRLHAWRRRLAQQGPAGKPRFLPVRVVAAREGVKEPGGRGGSYRGSIAIELGGRCVIRVEAGFAPELLRAVVGALAEEPPC
jgi:hypothetical protein